MDLTGKRIWQQACGDWDRNYVLECLNWDVILNGPGYAGAWPECKPRLVVDGWSSRKQTDIRRFAEDMSDGDLVVIRIGTSEVFGVGVIVGGYGWSELFADMDGWDLQHYRRVRWLWKGASEPKVFEKYDLKLGDTTQLLSEDSSEVREWLSGLNFTEEELAKPLVILPENHSPLVSHSEIAEYLYDYGVSSTSIETLLREFSELQRIAKWYTKRENAPSESETVTYLVVPLLRALGWTPQRMAVEWNKVDVALFDELPRSDESLSIVVEAKKKGNACLTAFSQAEGYAKAKTHCKRLIVTDGLRYGVFIHDGAEFKISAYFNIVDLRDSHPIYGCKGVKEALRMMTPEWRHS